MKTTAPFSSHSTCLLALAALLCLASAPPARAQLLLNVDFGSGEHSLKTGPAGTGQSTNDFWNLYSHYRPRFSPGMPLVANGQMEALRWGDGSSAPVMISVSNAPGVWGNTTGDPMYDGYIYARNGSNLTVTLQQLPPGRYHFYLYGHADPDTAPEQNSLFTLKHGTNVLGPLTTVNSAGWKSTAPMQEQHQYVVFRDLAIEAGLPVTIEVAPAPNGLAVLNGLQIVSRGTSPPKTLAAAPPKPASSTNLDFHAIRYDGQVTDTEARFKVSLAVESQTTNEISAPLFDGEVALVMPELPAGVRITSQACQYFLHVAAPGTHQLNFDLLAKITKAEPWNQISFTGPAAAIASVKAAPAAAGVEMQLLSGTALEGAQKGAARIEGFLGADRLLSLRWQSKAAEVNRKSLVTVDTVAAVQSTPTVLRFNTQFRYEILQAPLPRLTVELPAGQTLIRLQGEQIRDWQVKAEGARQVLNVEFIKPVEKNYSLTLISEQPLEAAAASVLLVPPQPLDVERESGTFAVSADDMLLETESMTGLRQINAAAGALAAYRFFGRPLSLTAKLERIEPLVKTSDRVTARLEETRLLISHDLELLVEKAGIYSVNLTPQPGLTVAEVHGDEIEEWKAAGGQLHISFNNRVLGARKIEVVLERPLKTVPEQIAIGPLRLPGATNETAQIGAGAALGFRLKTAGDLAGLREIPITALPGRNPDDVLAFNAEQPQWQLSLAVEKLAPRVVADVFNLITIGDGIIGGSATVRYGLINQGVQEFKVRVPAHWKNVEFLGQNIRRKEQAGQDWTINLQDKAWGGYTLVVTYDYQFDPKGATLDLAGLHTLGIERESGSVAVTVAGNLEVAPSAPAEPLRQMDPGELSETDRAIISRPVFVAYRYAGDNYALTAAAKQHAEVKVLDAVADRTQITTVLTEAGEMLSQATFMVKNNDRQFQKFRLPTAAVFWAAYVNNQPVKAERDGEWLLVALPRGANRDTAIAVDIIYKQGVGSLDTLWPRRLPLAAPQTDVPNTYAEWQLHTPYTELFSGFAGNMTVARGTTYDLRDAWDLFINFYADIGVALLVGFLLFALVGSIVVIFVRSRGMRAFFKTAAELALVVIVIGILAAMAIPNFIKARTTAQKNSCINSLRQIDGAREQWALENKKAQSDANPNLDDLIGTDKYIRTAPSDVSYVGGGKKMGNAYAIIAYSSPDAEGGRSVLFGNGEIVSVNNDEFSQMVTREAATGSAQLPQGYVAGQKLQISGQVAQNAPAAPAAGAACGQGLGTMVVPPSPMAAGMRSIRIDIPRAGKVINFTRVLNLQEEPLSVNLTVMQLKAYKRVRAAFQLTTFLVGLGLVGWQLRSRQRSSFKLALGWALILGSVGHMFISWRSLHWVLIIGFPALALLILVKLAIRYWPRQTPSANPPAAGPTPTNPQPPPLAPAAAVLIACFCLANPARAQSQNLAPRAPATNAVTLVSAAYTGAVREKVAQFDLSLDWLTATTNQTVYLFGDDVAIQDFQPGQSGATLLRRNQGVYLHLPDAAKGNAQLKLVVKLGGDVSKRQLTFAIPPALASKLALTIDEADADVEFPSAVAFHRTTTNKETRVEAILGAGDRVEMLWTPRVKRATEIAASIFSQATSVVSFGNGVVNTRSVINFQITQGEMRQGNLRLPAGQRLLRVEGDLLRTWELTGNDPEQTLHFELVKPIAPTYRLIVETERPLEKLPAQISVAVPRPQDVIRASGQVALRGAEELALDVESTQNLQRMDAAEFARTSNESAQNLLAAFSFLRPDFQLRVRAASVQPQIEAVAMNALRIGFDRLALQAQVAYTIKKAGVFTLRLAVPENYKVDAVTGNEVKQWSERTAPHTLEITLKSRTLGACLVNLQLSLSHKELPKTIDVPEVRPLEVQKLSGFLSVVSETGISAKTAQLDGLTEVPAATLPSSMSTAPGTLAYKFIAPDPKVPAWKLSVDLETVESWVRAEVVNLVSISETLLSGRALVRFDIANAPVKEFRLKVPAGFTNVEITGADIRRRDQNGEEWRIELQNKTRGAYTLQVAWEQPRATGTNRPIVLTGVAAPGVERETGSLVLLAKPPLAITEKTLSDHLAKIDVRELPDWAGVSAAPNADGEVPTLVYRYLRPGWTLAAEAKRYADAAVLQAILDSVRLVTVVADDGQMMTEMTLAVRNHGRQHLEFELPKGSTIWSAFVAGQPVRPANRQGKFLLPLQETVADDTPVLIEVTFVAPNTFPAMKGNVDFLSPHFDIPLKNARWELYLPPDYVYADFRGTMTREASAASVVQVYSQSEYLQQESFQLASKRSSAANNLRLIRESISKGKLSGARGNWDALTGNTGVLDEAGARELKSLEQDYRRAQGTNLLRSQRDYIYNNALKLGDAQTQQRVLQEALEEQTGRPQKKSAGKGAQAAQSQGNLLLTDYDTDVAAQQWERLEKAQQVKLTAVQPLHANLPTRGQRLAFTQVLQTETGKPMTIHFQAVNSKETGWLNLLATTLAAFAALWLIVALLSAKKQN